MITLEVKYKNQMTTVNLYNEWDVREEDVVDKKLIKKESQRGKYVEYDDGWNTYGKIKGATINAYVTETGIVKRKDYCSFCRVQYPYTNYSGARSYDEHPFSRPFRRQEYLEAGKFVKTNQKVHLTPRIKMIIKDRIEEMLGNYKVDADFIVSKLVREADNMRGRGTDRIEAIKILARMSGVELEKQAKSDNGGMAPLFFQMNNFTIQEQRRAIPSNSELTEIVVDAGLPAMDRDEAVEFVGQGKGYSGLAMNPKKLKNKDKIVEDGVVDGC